MEIDGINQNLYFNAAQMAAQSSQKTQKKEKTEKTRKTFSSAMERAREESVLAQEGLPPEIAGMEPEDAVVFLMDQADIAADKLKESQLSENFVEYRKKISQFIKYVAKNNFEVKVKQRKGFTRTGKPLPPRVQVAVINQKLDEIASYILNKHKDTLHMLAKVDEIKGMMIDLIAT